MKCEYCGKEHDGSYGSGRFCSSRCKQIYLVIRSNKSPKRKHKYICSECKIEYIGGLRKKNDLCSKCNAIKREIEAKIKFE